MKSIRERMQAIASNPFIDKPQVEIKKLQIEIKELNLNYQNCDV